jgi:hypothetical protein
MVKKIIYIYLFTSLLWPVVLQPSKKITNLEFTECLKGCVKNCGEDNRSMRYTWSYCASVALFLAPVIEYTGIFLEQRDIDDKATILRITGLYEGLAGATSVKCMEKLTTIAQDCHRYCEEACNHGTVRQNQTHSTLQKVISEIDKAHKEIKDFTLMTKCQYSGDITTSRRVQIEEQAFRDIWQHAEDIVYWFSYRNSNGKSSGTFMFDKKLKQLRHDGGIHWILSSIDQMVRTSISLDKDFCALWPDWLRIQLRVMEAQAYTVARSAETFLGIEDHLSPLKYSRNRLYEQIIFSKKKCLKPSIVKKDLRLKDFW